MRGTSRALTFNQLLLAAVMLVSVAVFLIDIQFPLGIAGGEPYALIVMATYWINSRQVTVGAGILSTVLTVAGFFLSESSEYLVMATANRFMAVVVIWASVWFVNRYKTSVYRIRKNEERLLESQRLAQLGNFELDLQTGTLSWSDEIFRIFDMDPKDGEPSFDQLMEMIHPEDRNHLKSAIERVRQEVKPQKLEICTTTKSGRTKCLDNIINPKKNQDGTVDKIFGTTHDITERKKAEEQRKEQEHRYRTLFQATTDEILVFQVDEDKNPLPFMEVNDIACELLGYDREELLQKTIYEIVAAEKEEVDKRIAYLLDHNAFVRHSRHRTKNGEIIPLETSAHSFRYGGQRTIISIGRDIRDRRKLEQEILNISEQERRRIGRELHDDLGQMLSGIGLITRNLANKLQANELSGAGQVKEISEMIKEADQHARRLARGLALVNIDDGGLNTALRELTDKWSTMYDIDIAYSGTESEVPEFGDQTLHMYRIAQEAVNNAVKHARATTVKIALDASNEHFTLSVKDDGIGLPEPEQRGDGMGVRIMNYRAQIMGGELEIKAERGEGTEIICRIPRNSQNS